MGIPASENRSDPPASARAFGERQESVATILEEGRRAFRLGQAASARSLLEQQATRLAKNGAPDERADFHLLLGKIERELGSYSPALKHFEDALELARDHALTMQEADALNGMSSIFAARGDASSALTHLEEAGTLFARLRNERKQADVLNNIGFLYLGLAEYRSALVSLREAHDLLKSSAPRSRSAAVNLQNLGRTYAALGEAERAEEFYRSALDLTSNISEPLIEIVSRTNLAEMHLEARRFDAAATEYASARRLSEEHGLKAYEISAIEGLGSVFFQNGRYAKAKAAHQRALELARSIGDTHRVLSGLIHLARDALAMGANSEAIEHAHIALERADRTSSSGEIQEAHALLAEAYKMRGEFESVVHHLEAAHAIERKIFNEESDENTRRLMVKFDVEKARFEAEEYRLQSEVARRAREEAEELVAARTRELEDAQVEIVTRLAVAAEYRDDDTGEHTRRVGRTAAVLAYVLARPIDDVRLIYNSARLHDVGKIGISDTILHKPARLTDAEFAKVKTHSTIGAKILADGHSPLLHMAERIAIGHHERWDGRGYPNGIGGEAIPFEARIVAVADVLDALLHERPYKTAWSLDEAIAEIERNGGSQFDPQVVEAALAAFGPSGPFSPQDVSSGWEDLRRELARVEHLRERFAARAERDPREG